MGAVLRQIVELMTYDALSRLLSSATPGETTVKFAYTLTGQRQSMTDASGTTTYSYDSLDRLTAKATPEGALSYTYYPAGQVETIASSNANGVSAAYTYDDAGRLQTVVDNRLTGNNTATYTYDAADNLTTAAYPNSPINAPSAFTYDTLDRLIAVSTPVSSYAYTLGPAGNLTKAVEGTGRTLNWTYDGIYRLTNEAIAADPNNVNGSVGYILDPVGNRKSANSSLSGVNTSPTVTYTSDDELSTGEGETYDNNGNTLTTGGKTFTYDAENHLMSMTNGSNVVTMVYDGDGNRVAKTVGGITTSYLIDDVNPTGLPQVMEELVNGAVARSYTYGLDRISENQLVNGAWAASFYGVDGMDSVRQLTNSSGSQTDTYEYDAFGNMVNKTGPSENTYTPNNYLYRGEQYDPDLGLYYLRARYYNPVTGRFLSADPLASQGQRRYQYAGADPVNGVDPSGMDLIPLAMMAQYANRVQIPSMDIHSWCGTTVGGQIVGVLPWCGIIIPNIPFSLAPPHPCSSIPGIPAYRASYLCRYYKPMVAKASAYGVDPALPLGLGIESHFADPSYPHNMYNSTGDAFGMSNGNTDHPVHASGPEDDVNKLFSEPTARGCTDSPYGERMRGTWTNVDLFLQRLERLDTNNMPLTGPKDKNGNRHNLGCMYNDDPGKWIPFIKDGIKKMQHDIPFYLISQESD